MFSYRQSFSSWQSLVQWQGRIMHQWPGAGQHRLEALLWQCSSCLSHIREQMWSSCWPVFLLEPSPGVLASFLVTPPWDATILLALVHVDWSAPRWSTCPVYFSPVWMRSILDRLTWNDTLVIMALIYQPCVETRAHLSAGVIVR